MPGALALHCCRLFEKELFPVVALVYDKTARRIVIARKWHEEEKDTSNKHDSDRVQHDTLLELWNFTYPPAAFLQQTLYYDGYSLEGVVCCQQLIVCSDGDGTVRSFSPHHPQAATKRIQVSASPLWSIAANHDETLVATGSDDGTLYLLKVDGVTVEFWKPLAGSFDARILSLAWHQCRPLLAGGSVDAIQLWCSDTGRRLQRIDVGRTAKRLQTLVWSLVFSGDVLVSGDSRGKTCFWDVETATKVSSHEMHEADVLAVCPSTSGETVFAAGVDPKIQEFNFIHARKQHKRQWQNAPQIANRGEWRPSHGRFVHSHDVRALASANHWLLSAGVDCRLAISRYPPKTELRLPLLDTSQIETSADGRYMLVRHSHSLVLWRLATAAGRPSINAGQFAEIETSSVAEAMVDVRCRGPSMIRCSAVNADASLIAYSDATATRIYRIYDLPGSNGDSAVCRLKPINGLSLPLCSVLQFRNGLLFGVTSDENNRLISIDPKNNLAVTTIHKSLGYSFGITALSVSSDGAHFAALTSSGHLLTGCQQRFAFRRLEQPTEHTDTKTTPAPLVALRFPTDGDGTQLICLDAARNLLRLSCNSGEDVSAPMTIASLSVELPTSAAVDVDVRNDVALVHDAHSLLIIKLPPVNSNRGAITGDIAVFPQKYADIAAARWLSADGVLVVQICAETLLSRLPPPLKVKRYGTG